MMWPTLIEEYLEWLKTNKITWDCIAMTNRELSYNTKETYVNKITQASNFFNGTPIDTIDEEGVKSYFNDLRVNEVSNGSINDYRKTLSNFWIFLMEEKKMVHSNPWKRIKYNVNGSDRAKTQNSRDEQVIELIKKEKLLFKQHPYLDSKKFRDLRDMTIVALIYCTGMRIGEVWKLKISDISFDDNQISIKKAKNYRNRYVTFHPIYNLMKRYFMERIELNGDNYFCKSNGDAFGYRAFSILVPRYLSKEPINLEMHWLGAHALRHLFCANMRANGIDEEWVGKYLGHSPKNITSRYNHITSKAMERIYEAIDCFTKPTFPESFKK